MKEGSVFVCHVEISEAMAPFVMYMILLENPG